MTEPFDLEGVKADMSKALERGIVRFSTTEILYDHLAATIRELEFIVEASRNHRREVEAESRRLRGWLEWFNGHISVEDTFGCGDECCGANFEVRVWDRERDVPLPDIIGRALAGEEPPGVGG